MASLELAFPLSDIPASLHATLPPGISLRPLSSTDHARNHLSVLADLTHCPDPGVEAWTARFHYMVQIKSTYYPIILLDTASDTVVATGTLFLERKFVRGLGTAGHVEDIAVSSTAQGKGLGKKVIEVLTALSESLGAYKVRLARTVIPALRRSEEAMGADFGWGKCSQTILDCDPKNEGAFALAGGAPRFGRDRGRELNVFCAGFYVKCGCVQDWAHVF